MISGAKPPPRDDYRWYRMEISIDGRRYYTAPVMARTQTEAAVQGLALAFYMSVQTEEYLDRTRPAEAGADPRQTSFADRDPNGT